MEEMKNIRETITERVVQTCTFPGRKDSQTQQSAERWIENKQLKYRKSTLWGRPEVDLKPGKFTIK